MRWPEIFASGSLGESGVDLARCSAVVSSPYWSSPCIKAPRVPERWTCIWHNKEEITQQVPDNAILDSKKTRHRKIWMRYRVTGVGEIASKCRSCGGS